MTVTPIRSRSGIKLLSVVVPARNEAGNIAALVEDIRVELAVNGIPHEIVIVVDSRSTDRTWEICTGLASRYPEVAPLLHSGGGFGLAVIHGFDRMSGDAAVVMMADRCDSCGDLVRMWELLAAGNDCVFASRFLPGGGADGYGFTKLVLNRLANLFIRLLFGVEFNDTTNAFKAYRREVIDACRPFAATGFELTVELPLKAMVRGFSWAVIPTVWRKREAGSDNLRVWANARRYLGICLLVRRERRRFRAGGREEGGR